MPISTVTVGQPFGGKEHKPMVASKTWHGCSFPYLQLHHLPLPPCVSFQKVPCLFLPQILTWKQHSSHNLFSSVLWCFPFTSQLRHHFFVVVLPGYPSRSALSEAPTTADAMGSVYVLLPDEKFHANRVHNNLVCSFISSA